MNIIDRCALIIYSKNFLKCLVLGYWLYKIITSIFCMQGELRLLYLAIIDSRLESNTPSVEMSRQEASSAVTIPAIVIVSCYSGLLLDAYVLLIPLLVASVYEVVVASIKMAMVTLYTYNHRSIFDPARSNIAVLQAIFKGYDASMRKDPMTSFTWEAFIIFFAFLLFLVTVFNMSEIARKEQMRRREEYEQLRNEHYIVIDFPNDDDEQLASARIALSPPSYSMAIRNEGVRSCAPELNAEDTAPPSYTAFERDRHPASASSLDARTPPAAGAPPPLSTPHSAGPLAPPTYSTPAIARLEPPPPLTDPRPPRESGETK